MKRSLLCVEAVLTLAGILTVPSAHAWGCKGHQTVAHLAEKHLTPEAKQMWQALLTANPVDPQLKRYCGNAVTDVFADAATWADDERAKDQSTAPWHFIDIPLGATRDQLASSCGPDGCVTKAITQQLAILKDKTAPAAKRANALRFIIHFVGDLHQPLHATTNSDRGGNCVPVNYLKRNPHASGNSYTPNLHGIWDTELVEFAMQGADPSEFVNTLDAQFANSFAEWRQGGTQLESWAWEGHQHAVDISYGALPVKIPIELVVPVDTCKDNHNIGSRMVHLHEVIGPNYQDIAGAVVEERLAQAGIRLAMILNDAATVNISSNSFKVRSWQVNPPGDPATTGKCLDYGTSPSKNGATVFLNDCSSAHTIRVVELPSQMSPLSAFCQKDTQGNAVCHEVLLFAGNRVIGIHNPHSQESTLDGPAPPTQPATEFSLELQIPFIDSDSVNMFSSPANQIFALDGDSIILESSRPCIWGINQDPMSRKQGHLDYISRANGGSCYPPTMSPPPFPSPPPQLVIQIQNARGAIGSALVAGVRNLADNEFWDFNPVPGSGPFPTSGFVLVTSPDELWNQICSNPPAVTTTVGDIHPVIPPSGPCSEPTPENPMGGFKAGWGSVIVVTSPGDCRVLVNGQANQDIGGCIDLSSYPPVALPAGVTLRGDRRGTNFGPQLYANYRAERGGCGWCMLEISGDYARVTGLRMRGESRSEDQSEPPTDGISIRFPGPGAAPPVFSVTTLTEFITTIDHNDMSDWGDAAITGSSPYGVKEDDGLTWCSYPNVTGTAIGSEYSCGTTVPDPVTGAFIPIADDDGTLANVRVARNFLHNNERGELGYGANVARGLIDANTFAWNRHDITAGGEPHNQYRALNNLVMSGAPHYGLFQGGRLQDFDMHGTAIPSLWIGGAGGYSVEIAGNTFLGQDGHDYALRGYPAVKTSYHDNVSFRSESSALQFYHCELIPICTNDYNAHDFPITISNSSFRDSSPSSTYPARLGVGDFDGDGHQDLFMTTGAAWYYSPGASAEWRFLSAKVDKIDTLLLGDFDGDGRTDVVGMNPSGQFDVSWGGVSDFEVINRNPCATTGVPKPDPCPKSVHDMVVGDFDGDGTPDILYVDGKNWFVSWGGTAPFEFVENSSFRVKDLRFGHFATCGNGKETDVFGIVGKPVGKWMVTCAGPQGTTWGNWIPLPVSLTDRLHDAFINGGATTIKDLVVADFDGDGNADVAGVADPFVSIVTLANGTVVGANLVAWSWAFSPDGAGDWNLHWHTITSTTQGPEPCRVTFGVDQLHPLGPVRNGQIATAFESTLLAAVGSFAGQRRSDILLWSGDANLCIVQGGTENAQRQSRQDMR